MLEMKLFMIRRVLVVTLLEGGELGLILLGVGLLLTLWGLHNIWWNQARNVRVAQAILSLAPAIVAAIGIGMQCARFLRMSDEPAGFKMHDFAEITFHAMAYGLYGALATVVPAAVGIASLAKTSPDESTATPTSDDG